MGAWGLAPWDDDGAADWFADMFHALRLAETVEAGLLLDPATQGPKVRAAASVLIMLGRPYIWPIDSLARHLELAIGQLERLRELSLHEPGFATAIEEELQVLRCRMNKIEAQSVAPPTSWDDFF